MRARIEDLPLDRAPLLEAGEILVVRSGAYTGDSALISNDWAGSAPGYDLRLTPFPGVDARFVAYQLLSAAYLEQVELAKSRAAQPHINAEELGSIELDWTAHDRQMEIADYLDRETARIDGLVALKRQLVAELLERRRSLVIRGVVGLLDPKLESHDPGLPWCREVRKPWPAVKIKHVAKLGTGHTPSRAHPEYWVDCTVPWITTGEIQQVRDDRTEVISRTREKISELGLANSAADSHPVGTVVLCRTASAGYSAIMGSDMATSQDFVTWTCSDRLLPRYLLMCLRAMRDDLLGRLAFGSTHKTIYMPDIEDLVIPLPSVQEQGEVLADIDRRLDTIDKLSDRLSRQLDLLVEHRQSVITSAVSGELDLAG